MEQRAQPSSWSYSNACLVAKVDKKICNYFQRILGQSDIRQGQSESTAFPEMVEDRRLHIWSTSCLHSLSSFSLNILNIILQNHSVSFSFLLTINILLKKSITNNHIHTQKWQLKNNHNHKTCFVNLLPWVIAHLFFTSLTPHLYTTYSLFQSLFTNYLLLLLAINKNVLNISLFQI